MARYNNFGFMQWFYDMTTQKKMMLLTIIVTVSLLIVGGTGFYFNQKANKDIDIIYNNNLKSVMWINLARADLNAIRMHLYTGIAFIGINEQKVNENLQSLNTRDKQLDDNMEYVLEKAKEINNEELIADIKSVQENIAKYRDARKLILANINAGNKEGSVSAAMAAGIQTKAVVDGLVELSETVSQRAENRYKQSQADAKFATIVIISIIVLGTLISIFLSFVTSDRISGILGELGDRMKAMADGDLTISKLGRPEKSDIGDSCAIFDQMLGNLQGLVKTVAKSAEEVSASSQEMSASSEQTAQGAQQVATSVSQLAAGSQEQASDVNKSLENINDVNKAIQNISSSAQKTVEMSTSAEKKADEGRNQAEEAVEKINQIKTKATGVSNTINELGQLSSDIEQIVDLIKNIASQTNLLALNAAIEAARAGEHGKGFAVVAEEVKKLAGQSANATDKITGMIKEIQNKTNMAVVTMNEAVQEVVDGVGIVENTGNSLEEILKGAQLTSKEVDDIAKEVNNVAKNAEALVKMMENVASIIEESSASAEEISSISEEQSASTQQINASAQSMAKIAEALQKQIATFKI